jgi:hypothetical protein
VTVAEARAMLSPFALAFAADLAACAPPLAPRLERLIRASLGPCVPSLTAQDARMTQAQAARTAA